MSKEDIIKIIEAIDAELRKNEALGSAYIPTTKLLINARKMWCDMLLRVYGVFYD